MIDIAKVSERLIYRKETGDFIWKKFPGTATPGAIAGQISAWGYVRIPLFGKKHSAHRLVWLMEHGELPSSQLDHIDGDKKNNHIDNLRLVTPSLNQLCNNKPRKGNKTGFVGVRVGRTGKFKAQLRIKGEYRYLGEFMTAEEASAAYQSEKTRYLNQNGIYGFNGIGATND